MSQTPEGSAPSAHSSHTPLGAAQAVLSYLGQSSSSEHSTKPTAVLDAAAHNVMSRIDKASESSTSAVVGAAQNVMSRIDKASESSTSAVVGAAQSLFSRLEKPSEASTSAAVMGAAQSVLSRVVSPSAPHQASSNLASHPLPELPHEDSAEAPAPPDAPQQRAVDPGVQAHTSVSSHGGAGGRAITPPRGTARRDSRPHRSHPALPEATHQRPLPTPYGTAYRRSTGPYLDGETVWHAGEERDPVRSPTTTTYLPSWSAHSSINSPSSQFRPKNVGERLEDTIKSAETERAQAAERGKGFVCVHHTLFDPFSCSHRTAKSTGMIQNIALALQVLIGALTTALGAALSGKNVRSTNLPPNHPLKVDVRRLLRSRSSAARLRSSRRTWRARRVQTSHKCLLTVPNNSSIFYVRSTRSRWTMVTKSGKSGTIGSMASAWASRGFLGTNPEAWRSIQTGASILIKKRA